MNVREMVQEVNHVLDRMDEQFSLAEKSFGVKPDIEQAKERVNQAGATVMELASLLDEMSSIGFHHPPDVVQRVRDKYAKLHRLAVDIAECEHIVFVRSHAGRKQSTLN